MAPIAIILIFALMLAFAVSTVWALWWSIRSGQFAQFERGAASIFDQDEPIGARTDAFPDEKQAH